MSKAEEFAVLAKAVTPGEWEARPLAELPAHVRASWYDEQGRRYTRFVAVCESSNCNDDGAFIAWCGTNRELLEEALKWLEHMEKTV